MYAVFPAVRKGTLEPGRSVIAIVYKFDHSLFIPHVCSPSFREAATDPLIDTRPSGNAGPLEDRANESDTPQDATRPGNEDRISGRPDVAHADQDGDVNELSLSLWENGDGARDVIEINNDFVELFDRPKVDDSFPLLIQSPPLSPSF
jgi:hypothetical protein